MNEQGVLGRTNKANFPNADCISTVSGLLIYVGNVKFLITQ